MAKDPFEAMERMLAEKGPHCMWSGEHSDKKFCPKCDRSEP